MSNIEEATAVDIYVNRFYLLYQSAKGLVLVAFFVFMLIILPSDDCPSLSKMCATRLCFIILAPLFTVLSMILLKLLMRHSPIISISPNGIFDRRFSTDWIPWETIRHISSGKSRNQEMLFIDIYPEFDKCLPWKKITWHSRFTERAFGSFRYEIPCAMLRGGLYTLVEAIKLNRPGIYN